MGASREANTDHNQRRPSQAPTDAHVPGGEKTRPKEVPQKRALPYGGEKEERSSAPQIANNNLLGEMELNLRCGSTEDKQVLERRVTF